jgi:prepilin-type N-terminal cleavage/methylation domain-containing protein
MSIARKSADLRKGLSLIEVLVVIGILAVLIGFLIPAVMRVREAALRTHSINNLRQITIAVLGYASDHRSRLPALVEPIGSSTNTTFVELLPYLELKAIFDFITGAAPLPAGPLPDRCPPVYRNPLDPSVGNYPPKSVGGWGLTSYVCNAQVFDGQPNLQFTFQDGTSNTLLFAEQYGWRCRGTMYVYWKDFPTPRCLDDIDPFNNIPGQGRATFADIKCGDFHPLETGKTFQVAPSIKGCDPRMPNSTTGAGLQVGLADGSVRVLAPSISATTFWSTITPNAGDITQLD